MSESPLEQVKRLLENLSATDRESLIPFLASLPDSGLTSYNLAEELQVLREAHKIREPAHLVGESLTPKPFKASCARSLLGSFRPL